MTAIPDDGLTQEAELGCCGKCHHLILRVKYPPTIPVGYLRVGWGPWRHLDYGEERCYDH